MLQTMVSPPEEKKSISVYTNNGWVNKALDQVCYAELIRADQYGMNGFYKPLVDCEKGDFKAANYLFDKYQSWFKIEHILQVIEHPEFNANYLLLVMNALDWGNPTPITTILNRFGDNLALEDFLQTFTRGAFEGKNSLWLACDAASQGYTDAFDYLLSHFSYQLTRSHFSEVFPKSGRDIHVTALDCLQQPRFKKDGESALTKLWEFELIPVSDLDLQPILYHPDAPQHQAAASKTSKDKGLDMADKPRTNKPTLHGQRK